MTDEALAVNDEEVTATVTFVPSNTDGTVEVTSELDSTGLAGGLSYVAFEHLHKSGIEDAIAAVLLVVSGGLAYAYRRRRRAAKEEDAA